MVEYKRASKATTLAMSNANKKIDEMERVTNAQRKTVDSLQQQNEALEAKADAASDAASDAAKEIVDQLTAELASESHILTALPCSK